VNRILLLDQATANRIAAGEVVTRPSSVIKELVENAIDAGATSIFVEVKNGGMKEIFVSDNGSGIHGDDLPLAFLRHATGKTRIGDEVFGLTTLGFRGEALSSIAAVSHVKLTSRLRGSEMGKCITLSGGEVTSFTDVGCPEGTSIYVNDLFYNTPARLKFIKSIGAESASCADAMAKLILAYPKVSIRFSNNGNKIYHSPGKDLASAILSVYGKEIYDNLIPVEYINSRITVSGYIGNGTIARKNRSLQTTIVNGRVVRSQRISQAVSTAFSERMMIGKFPFYVLNITVKEDRVDANVHPQKTEVKLMDEDGVVGEVMNAIEGALTPRHDIRQLTIKGEEQKPNSEAKAKEREIPKEYKDLADAFIGGTAFVSTPKGLSPRLSAAEPKAPFTLGPKVELKLKGYPEDAKPAQKEPATVNAPSSAPIKDAPKAEAAKVPPRAKPEDAPAPAAELAPAPAQKAAESQMEFAIAPAKPGASATLPVDVKVIGQVFSTYLLIQHGENLLIIDQHAAHERLNYDHYMAQMERQAIVSQPLLTAAIVNVTAEEAEMILNHKDLFTHMGFDLDSFGPGAMAIRAVPAIFTGMDITGAFLDILSQLTQTGRANRMDIIRERIITTCCRMSIKAGQPLLQQQIIEILSLLRTTPKLTCPHGRPIVMKLSKGDLEKNFKRIQ